MSITFVLIGVLVVVLAAIIYGFIWAAINGPKMQSKKWGLNKNK